MKSVHFVGGEKGGVGKTTVARLLCHELSEWGGSWVALDADTSQNALLRGYPEQGAAVDLSIFSSADTIMDHVLEGEDDVVVDLPAQSHRLLRRWFEQSDVLALATEHQVRLVFWYVTDGGYPSVSCLAPMVPWLTEPTELIVVRNRRWSDDFSRLEASAACHDLSARGGRLVDLPSLEPALMFELERRGGHFGRALQAGEQQLEGGALTPMQRRRLQHWLGLVRESFQPEPRPAEPKADGPALGEQRSMLGGADESDGNSPSKGKAPVGSTWIDGATTWTEVGDGELIHHVRCP